MLNPDETIRDLQKYLKKLQEIIDKKASLTLINVKLVNKTAIDDIFCCIEATIPTEYKNYSKKKDAKKLKSHNLYRMLKEKIQNKFLFSSSSYAVRFKETPQIIAAFMTAFNADLRYIFKEDSGML